MSNAAHMKLPSGFSLPRDMHKSRQGRLRIDQQQLEEASLSDVNQINELASSGVLPCHHFRESADSRDEFWEVIFFHRCSTWNTFAQKIVSSF